MTRKNRDPKEYLLSILIEHVKFLRRMTKKEIPDKMLTLINERIKSTNQQIVFVNKEYFDYQKAITEFKNEQKAFNRQIRILEKKIKKLEKTIKKKDVEIEKKDEEIEKKDEAIENLHIMINTQSEVISKNENEIMILEGKMSRLQVEHDECVESNISLSYKLEIERTEVENLRTEVNNLQSVNHEQTTYIQTKDRNLRKLVDENFNLESDNVNLKKKNEMLDQRLERASIFSCARSKYGN
ncbi:15589_t:CDS:2 [Dentiscutata erythropus]|uniref:15589_t:CDS:1 n=1 Tax=Dentiscutata erythropus TaxID=1348616 RepID=A0A9N8ZRT5_9GLOM|nr:15589_t:CDS:2 [Dentiscutata erythropus]